MPRTLRRWSFLKKSPPTLETIRTSLPKGTPLELWWQDEARVGQKNKTARRWARRGTRPRAPHDQRTSSVYIFGAICPQQGKGAALVLPRCDTQAMSLHLAEVAQAVAPGAHGVLLMDRAGWHCAKDLVVPDNLTLVLLPARAPELNPVENIWQFLRDNWLSSRVFASYRDIVDHCCDAWNRLIDQPWIIMSIGLRDWANAFQCMMISAGWYNMKQGRIGSAGPRVGFIHGGSGPARWATKSSGLMWIVYSPKALPLSRPTQTRPTPAQFAPIRKWGSRRFPLKRRNGVLRF